eukprot:TRINITY_DN4595_c1_g1_i1.p1 TRINITY_DN4595_c1_g1~~TRINITY_DN4595_c1_g1_i1.p1  ORF type:complete len:67 (+),score=12.71 TRINITY_DN4595_c1_g1_i1:318-518(+)
MDFLNREKGVCYLDCPGEFDNKSEKQNIINACIKEHCGKTAEQIKITLVLNIRPLKLVEEKVCEKS